MMLLYDVTSERSFTSVRHWVQCIDVSCHLAIRKMKMNDYYLQDVSEKRIPIILCGNKVDQRTGQQAEGRRCVGAEDGEKTAREHSAIFMETSSRDGHNILDSLVLLAREMCSNEDVEVQTSTLLIRCETVIVRAEKVEGRGKVFRLIVQLISGMISRKITVVILRSEAPPDKTLCV